MVWPYHCPKLIVQQISFFILERMGKLAAPQPSRGLSFIRSIAFDQINNLGELKILSKVSMKENLDNILLGKIFVANSWKPKGKIFVLAAKSNTENITISIIIQKDNDDFKKITLDKNKV